MILSQSATTEYKAPTKGKTRTTGNRNELLSALSVIRHDEETTGVVYANNTVPFTSLVTDKTRYNKKTEQNEKLQVD